MSDPVVVFDGVGWNAPDDGGVQGLSFSLPRSGALVLAGGGLSGKSTIMALCLGGRHADAGRVNVLGADPATLHGDDLERLRIRIGYVPQRGGLIANVTLPENIALPVAYHRRLGSTAADQVVTQVYRLLGIDPLPEVLPGDASRLLCQVAALARALVLAPELLLVDEPGAGLDDRTAEELWRLLWRVQSETGTAVLATASDARLAGPLTDNVVQLPEQRHLIFSLIPGVG